MKTVRIYTDGACSGNPGPGGWGAVLLYNGTQKTIYGGARHTTNQRMELKGAIEALKTLKQSCNVHLYTDSAYLYNGISQNWYEKWRKNGWRTSKNEPVSNIDLWHELIRLVNKHNVQVHKVKGHSGDEFNTLADKLAHKGLKIVKANLAKVA